MESKRFRIPAALATLVLVAGLVPATDAAAAARTGRASCGQAVGFVRVVGQQSNAQHGLYLQIGDREALFTGTRRQHLDGGRGPASWATVFDSLTYGAGVCIPQ
ncbi:hypothetical protein [Actinomyces urogenitalis]|uniref:hypothetical protein n=1 Tax=Actinomyces urogenitalis TaxID=103621 RepID=UPI0024300DD3|nr:hypothetical protein [Actinomyces urogenitalis]MCI7456552.1 hypothetical protein [Actinomyces urogenitalis]